MSGVNREGLEPAATSEFDPKRTSCRPVVLMHNHPGGDPTPSRADIEMTRVIVEIGKQVRYCDPGPHHRRQARSRQSKRTEADLNDVASLGQSGPHPWTQRENARAFIRRAISGCAHRGCTRASSRRSQRRDGTVSTDRNLIA